MSGDLREILEVLTKGAVGRVIDSYPRKTHPGRPAVSLEHIAADVHARAVQDLKDARIALNALPVSPSPVPGEGGQLRTRLAVAEGNCEGMAARLRELEGRTPAPDEQTVERGARALFRLKVGHGRDHAVEWRDLSDDEREKWRKDARAVLAAASRTCRCGCPDRPLDHSPDICHGRRQERPA